MTLLKDDGTVPTQQNSRNMNITAWPTRRLSNGIGISIKDGWNVGIGFGLAMAIAVPLILLLLGCIIGIGIVALGGSLGALL
jgi:hypothetical protein